MNALVLNCSPVRNGATAEIVSVVADCLTDRYTVRSVCIDDYDFAFCKGCRSCHQTARCVMQDGFDDLLAQFAWADTII